MIKSGERLLRVLGWIVPVVGLVLAEMLVAGCIVIRHASRITLEAVLDDSARGLLTQEGDHGQLGCPDVE